MPLATAFRLSFFVTLALASTCLALAETFFLPWMSYFLLGALVLMGLAFRWEGRWVLSADAANRLGMVIAIVAAFWILYNLPRTEEDLLAAGVPWPAGLLPHLGPVLMLLLLVKLFRPKRLPDYWVIQTIGLMMVTLSCVLAAESLFGVLLVFYLAGLLWSLFLFCLVREAAVSRADTGKPPGLPLDSWLGGLPLFDAAADAPAVPLPFGYLGIFRVARWTLLVVPAGLLLFLVAPRKDNFQWEPKQLATAAKGLLRTGFEGDMDLNRIGKIELSQDPAFDVEAMDTRGPILDLGPETRWFMQSLDFYFQGRWTNWDQGAAAPQLTVGIPRNPSPLPLPPPESRLHPSHPPADLADSDMYLSFKVRLSAAGGLVLAEPLTGTRLGMNPYLGDNPVGASIFFRLVSSDSLLSTHRGRLRAYQYGQLLRKSAQPNLAPAKDIHPNYVQFLVKQTVPEPIVRWIRELLTELPGLTAAERRLDADGRVAPAAQVKVAQALSRYLAYSGEFGYSLDLHRQQMNLDPLADFLLNVKEGHCERYAGGLTLMLRALGIPARVVKGYRGLEHVKDGLYVVRQSHAHSWVQALVDSGGAQWLTLDPTPGTERLEKPLLSWFGWLFQRWSDGDNVWRDYIMEYNADQQGRTLDFLQAHLTPDDPQSGAVFILVVGAVVAGGFLAFRLRRRRRSNVPVSSADPSNHAVLGTGFYPRFLDMADRMLHVKPAVGQTPLEFGQATQVMLEDQAVPQEHAAIPVKLIDLLYQARFGGRGLTPAQEMQANGAVDQLESHLSVATRTLVPAQVGR